MEQYYYLSADGQVYSSYQMQVLFGINVETTAISILNLNSFYPVQTTEPDFDLGLYTATSVWILVPISGGEGAAQVWTAAPRPLPVAKVNGRAEAIQASDTSVNTVVTSNFLTSDVLASVASQALVDRPASLQVVLDETVVLTNALGVKLDAIAAATTVDEINNIVNPPTGTLFTGRGAGEAPLDLNVSYYTLFNSVSMTEADTELYVPGTSTVIPYGSYPGGFDSIGDCFTLGNYLLQIRETATGSVIAEFECPLAPAGENVSF